MKKLLITCGMVLALANVPAHAEWRGGGGGWHGGYRNGWVGPAIVGGLALGLGAYALAPRVYAPPPVYYAPPVYAPPPVYYAPPPAYYAPPQAYPAPSTDYYRASDGRWYPYPR